MSVWLCGNVKTLVCLLLNDPFLGIAGLHSFVLGLSECSLGFWAPKRTVGPAIRAGFQSGSTHRTSPTIISTNSPCCSRLHQILSEIQTRKVLQEFNLQDERRPWEVWSGQLLSLDEHDVVLTLPVMERLQEFRRGRRSIGVHCLLWGCVNCMRSLIYIFSNNLRESNILSETSEKRDRTERWREGSELPFLYYRV